MGVTPKRRLKLQDPEKPKPKQSRRTVSMPGPWYKALQAVSDQRNIPMTRLIQEGMSAIGISLEGTDPCPQESVPVVPSSETVVPEFSLNTDIHLNSLSAEQAQQALRGILKKLQDQGHITAYSILWADPIAGEEGSHYHGGKAPRRR